MRKRPRTSWLDEDLETVGADDEELDLSVLPKGALAVDLDADGEEEDELEPEDGDAAPVSKKLAGKKGQKPAPTLKPTAAKPSALSLRQSQSKLNSRPRQRPSPPPH